MNKMQWYILTVQRWKVHNTKIKKCNASILLHWSDHACSYRGFKLTTGSPIKDVIERSLFREFVLYDNTNLHLAFYSDDHKTVE